LSGSVTPIQSWAVRLGMTTIRPSCPPRITTQQSINASSQYTYIHLYSSNDARGGSHLPPELCMPLLDRGYGIRRGRPPGATMPWLGPKDFKTSLSCVIPSWPRILPRRPQRSSDEATPVLSTMKEFTDMKSWNPRSGPTGGRFHLILLAEWGADDGYSELAVSLVLSDSVALRSSVFCKLRSY
jgi:hypothetical protein